MCDQPTLDLIQETVDEKIDRNVMFTAFEVSLEVKDKCRKNGLNVPSHSNIKADIHNAISNYLSTGIVSRRLQEVGAPSPAYVYYPPGSNPDNYVPLTRMDGPKQQVTAQAPVALDVATSSQQTSVNVANDNDGDCQATGLVPDSRGTLCIPNYLAKMVGLTPGDTAYVTEDSNSLVLSSRLDDPNSAKTTYTVDAYGNVRITKAVLAALGNQAIFKAEAKDNKVKVSV